MKFHVQKKKIVRITIKYKVRIKSVQKCLLIPAGVTMTQGSSEYKPGEVVYSLRQEAVRDIVKFSISVKTIRADKMDEEQQPKDGGIEETGQPLLTENQGRFSWVSISAPRCEANPRPLV